MAEVGDGAQAIPAGDTVPEDRGGTLISPMAPDRLEVATDDEAACLELPRRYCPSCNIPMSIMQVSQVNYTNRRE